MIPWEHLDTAQVPGGRPLVYQQGDYHTLTAAAGGDPTADRV